MIWLVGAGPGDSGLMTLRGFEVLKNADVVIYDRLVGEGVLAMIPESSEKIDAGKSSGSHTMTQSEIESAMIFHAKAGKNVVRLKGGDPFLFGRGGEEAEALIKAGMPFEVVPGVTSALSVPAYAGIPATHRDFSSGVKIITAHDKNNLMPDFSDSKNKLTSIFLMGAKNSEALQKKLSETMDSDTPCAIISNGTTALQKTTRTTISHLSEKSITPPAVIIAGKAAALNLSWRENLRLNGKRIIITRPASKAESLAKILRDKGAEAISLPTIKTETIHGSLDNIAFDCWNWIAFTSAAGVDALFEILAETGRDIRELHGAKIAAIGPATAKALQNHAIKTDFIPEIFDGQHLAEGLISKKCGKILMLRAENGTPEIERIFMKYGISYKNVCVYRTDYVKLFHVPEFADMIVFTSSSTVRGLAENTKGLRGAVAVCIGRQTAEEAVNNGFINVRIAKRADIESIIEACEL